MSRHAAIILVAASLIAAGCEKSSEPAPEEYLSDGAALLGLTRNHELHYIVYDSIVADPFDSVRIIFDTSLLDIAVTRGQSGQVELGVNGTPHDLLTIDEAGILHSGQIRTHAQPPDTLFFYPTPLIMPRRVVAGGVWSYSSPPFAVDTTCVHRTLLFLNYGFHTERTFLGRVNIVLPTSSYDAYRFQSFLFYDETSSDTFMTADEYYAPGTGLVKLESHSGLSRRLIILLEDD